MAEFHDAARVLARGIATTQDSLQRVRLNGKSSCLFVTTVLCLIVTFSSLRCSWLHDAHSSERSRVPGRALRGIGRGRLRETAAEKIPHGERRDIGSMVRAAQFKQPHDEAKTMLAKAMLTRHGSESVRHMC